jgi:hypothetical protein
MDTLSILYADSNTSVIFYVEKYEDLRYSRSDVSRDVVRHCRDPVCEERSEQRRVEPVGGAECPRTRVGEPRVERDVSVEITVPSSPSTGVAGGSSAAGAFVNLYQTELFPDYLAIIIGVIVFGRYHLYMTGLFGEMVTREAVAIAGGEEDVPPVEEVIDPEKRQSEEM